jgi:hypothetical protein
MVSMKTLPFYTLEYIEKTTNSPIRLFGGPAEIRTWCPQNTGLERYPYANFLGP